MGYAPRLAIRHTSATAAGLIYVPFVNWTLMIGIALLVLGLPKLQQLAAAYGIAVTAPSPSIPSWCSSSCVCAGISVSGWRCRHVVFLTFDLSFGANAIKFPDGGWFPVVVAMTVFTVLTTWKRGTDLVSKRMGETAARLSPP